MVIQIFFIMFFFGFFSDIILQKLSYFNRLHKINLFKPFWDYYGYFNAALIAGLISAIFGLLFLIFSIILFQQVFNTSIYTSNLKFLLFSTFCAFLFGIFFDILCNINNWFGLIFRKWYDGMGIIKASLWSGGLTFGFLNFCSLLIYYFII